MDRRRLLLYFGSLLLTSCGSGFAPRPPIGKKDGAGGGAFQDQLDESGRNRSDGLVPTNPNDRGSLPSTTPININDDALADLKIALTVGHGQSSRGYDPGATSGQIVEYELNAAQATTIADILRARGATVKIFKYDNDHGPVNLATRGRNVAGHDIHISLHHNSFSDRSVQGGETLVHPSNVTDEDKIFAKIINDAVVTATGVNDRGVKSQNVTVLAATENNIVKCLCEPFFISNSSLNGASAASLSQKAAVAIAAGVVQYWQAKKGPSIRNYTVPEVLENDLPGLYDDHNDGSL